MREALARSASPRRPRPWSPTSRRAPSREPDAIRDALVRQVTGTVRWRESVAFMAGEGVDAFFELGAGKVLTGLVKRIAAGASGDARIGAPEDVKALGR